MGEVLGAVGRCDSCQEVRYSLGGETIIRKVYQMVERGVMVMEEM